MLIQRLQEQNLIHPPTWLTNNVMYLTMMGSVAYGVSSNDSDVDVYGFCIPPKLMVFPHLSGEIPGFGRQIQRFEQWQEHHTKTLDGNKEYDFSIYSIVKYFQLCMENNPNMIDSLFVPGRCILHMTHVAHMVRNNRWMFLHKGAWHKFKGYSYSQVAKMANKNPEGKRKELVAQFGYDVKFAYHVVRLLNEVEQILTEGDIDLERSREQLKSIRRGEWSEQQIRNYFTTKERELETLYTSSKLPHSPNEDKIKELLMQCLEHHYGSLSNAVINPAQEKLAIEEIRKIIERIPR